MSKIISALLLSAVVVLPGIAYAVPEAGSPGWGQCLGVLNAARKAGGNQGNGQNNVTPRSTLIQDARIALAEFGTCSPPAPTPPPPTE